MCSKSPLALVRCIHFIAVIDMIGHDGGVLLGMTWGVLFVPSRRDNKLLFLVPSYVPGFSSCVPGVIPEGVSRSQDERRWLQLAEVRWFVVISQFGNDPVICYFLRNTSLIRGKVSVLLISMGSARCTQGGCHLAQLKTPRCRRHATLCGQT